MYPRLKITPLFGIYSRIVKKTSKSLQPLVIFIGINNNNDEIITVFGTGVQFPLNYACRIWFDNAE